jgi:SAM-dependent methyltransferase
MPEGRVRGGAAAMTWEQAVRWLRDQPDQAELVRACFYDDPLDAAAARYHASTEWRAVRALLPAPPADALDLGAGRGIAAYALARDGYRVTALEPDPSEIVGARAIRALARATDTAIEVVEQHGEDLPFPAASFDVVFARAVLHHARDLGRLCSEIGRVLRPGGLVVAAREHVISRSTDLTAFLAAHPLHKLYGGESAYTRAQYERALGTAGIALTAVLNPFESDINLFPATTEETRRALARRLHLPAALVPRIALALAGALDRTPGRLYSFVGRRAHG